MISSDFRSTPTSSDRWSPMPRCFPLPLESSADWGGGKTSIMKMLERDLDPRVGRKEALNDSNYEKAAVIYFNGWQFEGYDDAKAAILSSVLPLAR